MCIIHSHNCIEEIHHLFICCLVSVFLLPSLPTCHFNTHLTQHICSSAILAHRCFLIFSFLLYLIPPGFAVEPPTTSLPCPSAANGAAHLLRQEVWSQREPGDSEPAGQLPVRNVSPGNARPALVLGERLRRAGRCGQSVRHAAHVLPLLLAAGSGQSCRLAAGEPEGSQLQVSSVNAYANISVWFVLTALPPTAPASRCTSLCVCSEPRPC